MGPETRIVRRIIETLEQWPRVWLFKVHGGPYQAAGIPDIIGVIDGRFVGIEVKAPGKTATKLQELVIRRIQQAGGIAGVATSVEEAIQIAKG